VAFNAPIHVQLDCRLCYWSDNLRHIAMTLGTFKLSRNDVPFV
jgi:hypothetical protein